MTKDWDLKIGKYLFWTMVAGVFFYVVILPIIMDLM